MNMTPSITPLAIFEVGGSQLFWIFLIVILLFGGAKLPSLAKGLGQSIKEFKKAAKDDEPEKPSDNKTSTPTPPKTNGHN